MASLTRLSPSMMAASRRGTPRRRAIEVAAIGSVGETTAPRTDAAGHGRSTTAQCATTPTTRVVAPTRPMDRRLNRAGVRAKVAELAEERRRVRSGGRNAIKDELGRQLDGQARHDAQPEPAEHHQDGIGHPRAGASTSSAPTPVRSPSSCSSSSLCNSMAQPTRASRRPASAPRPHSSARAEARSQSGCASGRSGSSPQPGAA